MAISLTNLSSGYNITAINDNFNTLLDFVNNSAVWRTGSTSGETTMVRDLDMNSYKILNYSTDVSDSTSLITIGVADERYYNVAGDKLTGPMDVNSQSIAGLPTPTVASQAVPKSYVDSSYSSVSGDLSKEIAARQEADASLQEQITGSVPLEASAFSPISWHSQTVDNSVVIPENKNAWSFGPTMTVSSGQSVTVGIGSYWTIANGEVNE